MTLFKETRVNQSTHIILITQRPKIYQFSHITQIIHIHRVQKKCFSSLKLHISQTWQVLHLTHGLIHTYHMHYFKPKKLSNHTYQAYHKHYTYHKKKFCLNTHITHITCITPNTWSKSRKQDYNKPHISNIFNILDLTLKAYESQISNKSHMSHI